MNILKNHKVHLVVLVVSVITELIGLHMIKIGIATITLIPFIFAFIIGILLTPAVTDKYWKGFKRIIDTKEQIMIKPFVTMSITLFLAKISVSIGASMNQIIKGGLALVLQEFGNVGTVLFTVPVAVLLLKMGRETIGATFSVTREPSLALAAEKWGLESELGIGTMGTYIVGVLIGVVFFSIVCSVVASLNIFHPYALAMATGVGSASMMVAGINTITVLVPPDQVQTLVGFAAASNLLTTATGMYMSIYVAMPLAQWMYKKLSKDNMEDFIERSM